jgi:acetyl-CoA carboxylase carboxyl transferase subunit beta
MSWLKRKHTGIKSQAKRDVAPGVFTKCEGCREILIQKELERNLSTCPKCGYHFRVRSDVYLGFLLDENSFDETNPDLSSLDPLEFRDARMRYPDRIALAQKTTGMKDAVLTGRAEIGGKPVAVAAMDFFFMGGSMGSVVGEKVARTFDLARAERRAVITVTSSGGARMQEGILSLMQLAKTSVAAAELREARLPFLSILTDPSTAGVMASFASLGDVILAEPAALVGFAGPRVIQDTIREELPEGFQRSEFVLEHGFIDRVVPRKEMRDTVAALLEIFHHGTQGFTLGAPAAPPADDPPTSDTPRISVTRPKER